MNKIQDNYIEEKEILGISLNAYGRDTKEYSVTIQYKFNSLLIPFNNDKQNALSFMEDLSKKVTLKEDDYIKGFKDGVEYALKLKSNA